MIISRRSMMAGLAAAGIARPALAVDMPGDVGIGYLERLGQSGALNPKVPYVPPSKIDAAYSHAIYVNTALKGPGAQKMWIIERDGAGWKLALWDEDLWEEIGTPPAYSWPVSTGRHYKGDKRSGPTPVGIFNVDDRAARHRRGWGSPGMFNSIYIDLHYNSGRASGIAMHGTTGNKYRLLGRADSHGCIRMQQSNAETVWRMFHPTNRPGQGSPLWSEAVPRYFTSAPVKGARWGYVRNGAILTSEAGERLTKPGYSAVFVFFRDDI